MLTENQEASTAQDEVQGQNDQTEVQNDTQDNTLSKEQAYAKKMRQRAQVAEEKLGKLEQDAKDETEKRLANQGKYRTAMSRLKPLGVGVLTAAGQEGWQFASNIIIGANKLIETKGIEVE